MKTTKIPTLWHDVLSHLIDLDALPTRLLLAGPPGTGKSRWGSVGDADYERIAITPDTDASDLLGGWSLRAGETTYVDGPAVRAMMRGCRLILDEIDRHGTHCESTLQSVLDSDDMVRLSLPDGRVIRPAKGYSVVCTSNVPADSLPAPIRDRLSAVIIADRPTPDALALLPDQAIRNAVLSTYTAREGEIPHAAALSYRTAAEFARLVRNDVTPELAARIVWGNNSDEILSVFASHQ